MSRRRLGLLAAGCAAAATAGGLALQEGTADTPPQHRGGDLATFAEQAARLPKPQQPAFRLGRMRPARVTSKFLSRWAPVARAARVRRAPSPRSSAIARLGRHTSQGTTNIVLVVGERRIGDRSWVHVRLSVLPNDTTGWVPRSALAGYHFVRTRLVVDRRRLRATLLRDGRPVFSAPVGVGTSAAPTPGGEFYIREKVAGFDDPFYGPVAFGTSARSSVLTDWPDGGQIGIHGTNQPELLPGRVSHGCVRLRNEDIVRLSRLMPVGTPLTIA